MEQWIYARLYDYAMELMAEANEKFCGVDLDAASEDDELEMCYKLNETACAMGKLLRHVGEKDEHNVMNFKLVTWKCDSTLFLVRAKTDQEATRKAVEANLLFGNREEFDRDINDLSNYIVEDVDRNLLMGIYDEAIICF